MLSARLIPKTAWTRLLSRGERLPTMPLDSHGCARVDDRFGRAARSAALSIGIDAVWKTPALRATRAALIDGPVDRTHPALADASITAIQNSSVREPEAEAHATAVASVLVGTGLGMLGLCRGASVLSYAISTSTDLARSSDNAINELSAAIDDAVSQRVDVIVIPLAFRASLASRNVVGQLHQTMDRAASQGVAIIAAGANDATSSVAHGGSWERFAATVPVYGVSRRGRLMSRSSGIGAGRTRGVLAPGEDIPTATAGAGASLRSGSSFATAIVAGVFLALAARFPSTSAADIRMALTRPTHVLPSSLAGVNFVDAEASLCMLTRLTARSQT